MNGWKHLLVLAALAGLAACDPSRTTDPQREYHKANRAAYLGQGR